MVKYTKKKLLKAFFSGKTLRKDDKKEENQVVSSEYQRRKALDYYHHHDHSPLTLLYKDLRVKALEVSKMEPFMKSLLERTFLHPKVNNFNAAISRTVASRLMSSCGNDSMLCLEEIIPIFEDAMSSPILEYGSTMAHTIYEDILACRRRDPACKSELEVVLFYKGFASLVCHHVARRHYKSSRYVSLWLQSQASAAFGVDIHPAAEIGSGVFLDHATGLVIGETAVVGNNCTILHGVTLGGTGKVAGNRHPKVGNNLLIGAGTSILGNITIGNGAKIGAGSIVLKSIPVGATAVGTPAKIIGWTREDKPESLVDNSLVQNIVLENVKIASGGSSTISSSGSSGNSTSSTSDDISICSSIFEDKAEKSVSIALTENVLTDDSSSQDGHRRQHCVVRF